LASPPAITLLLYCLPLGSGFACRALNDGKADTWLALEWDGISRGGRGDAKTHHGHTFEGVEQH